MTGPCLDANVWVYYLDGTLSEHEQVRPAVRSVLDSRSICSTTVIQMEVVHYLHTQLDDPSGATGSFLDLEDVAVAELQKEDVERAAALLGKHPDVGMGGRDATIVVAMDRLDCDVLWTHDRALHRLGDRLSWLSVIDPVGEDVP